MFSANTQLSTVVYASEDNIGFIHPTKDRFTYFHTAGTRDTFGLSCRELAKEFGKFANNFIKDNPALEKELVSKLNSTNQSIQSMNKDTSLYKFNEEIADLVLATGHIPIMLSAISSAQYHHRAARSIGSSDVTTFFKQAPGAKSQGKEYCLKQAMMMQIGELRQTFIKRRYDQPNLSQEFILSNKFIIKLDRDIIKANQESLPPHQQFDLASTFHRKLFNLTCELDMAINSDLITKMITTLKKNKNEFNTVEFQQNLSDEIYEILIDHVKNDLQINLDDEDFAFSADVMNKLQDMLPILVYLNSPTNPFARNGLFGKIIKNDFYETALRMYKEHEAKQQCLFLTRDSLKLLTYSPHSKTPFEFNDEQILQLLDGVKPKKPVSQSASFLDTFQHLAMGSSSSDVARQEASERNQQLSLPQPPQYLAIEYNPENQNNPQGPSPK